jgi:hypothetical protein
MKSEIDKTDDFDAKGLLQKILDNEINQDTEELRKSTKHGVSDIIKAAEEKVNTDQMFDSKLEALLNFDVDLPRPAGKSGGGIDGGAGA